MRSRVELGLRAAALVLVALATWRVLAWQSPGDTPVVIDAALPLSSTLARLSGERLPAIHVPLARSPDVTARDWLVAVRRAGTSVTWSDAGLAPAAALSLTQVADPAGGVAISFATSGTGTALIVDTLGVVDSVALGARGARVVAASVQGRVTARRGSAMVASAEPPVPRELRPLLVVGSAGWESKFVAAALEERGWTVHTRIRVSPTAEVTHGTRARIDTANYAAVIVLDSSSALPAAALIAYVRAGGGLVLAGDAARVAAFGAISPARLGAVVPGSLLRSAAAAGRDGLPFHPLATLRADAAPIDARDGRTVAAARREGAGRVLTVGEIESWRWRMSGGPDGAAEHRRWWSRIVASVAYVPPTSVPAVDPEASPHAALIDALGEARADVPSAPRLPTTALPPWLGATILGLLVLEWASRRLRGER